MWLNFHPCLSISQVFSNMWRKAVQEYEDEILENNAIMIKYFSCLGWWHKNPVALFGQASSAFGDLERITF
jgi:hypothetical protein